MALEALYERRDAPWQSWTRDNKHTVQIAFNRSNIPFWRARRWFESDKAWSQWMPLAKCDTAEAAFAEACKRLAEAA